MNRQRRSPRARRPRLNSKAGEHHHGHDAPFINSPRAPPAALGPPPKALTPCWHPYPRNYYKSIENNVSPYGDYKKRTSNAKLFHPLKGASMHFNISTNRDTHDPVENSKDFNRFLLTSNMPLKTLLPKLHGMTKNQITERISGTKMFPHLMEKFQAKALGTKMRSGVAARSLIDPSANAWGDKSPRFSRARDNKLLMSNLIYRASPMGTFGADRDTFYVS